MELKDKIILNSGETLIEISHKTKGPVGETDIYKYKIINSMGDVVGYVDHTDHTSIKGFHRTQSAIQYDINNKVIIDIHW